MHTYLYLQNKKKIYINATDLGLVHTKQDSSFKKLDT